VDTRNLPAIAGDSKDSISLNFKERKRRHGTPIEAVLRIDLNDLSTQLFGSWLLLEMAGEYTENMEKMGSY